MSSVRRRDHESFEALLKRFGRVVQDAGVLSEARARGEFLPNTERRRLKKARSAARRRKAERLGRRAAGV